MLTAVITVFAQVCAPAALTAPDPGAPTAAAVVAAERAFAADAARMGVAGSFAHWSTPDAIVLRDGEVRTVRSVYRPADARPADEPPFTWWPTFAGMSRSADFGFSTGPVEISGRRSGHYFTVWKRQPDGTWRWIYDGGAGADAAGAPGPDEEPAVLKVPETGSGSAQAALAELASVEIDLADRARLDQRAGHLAVLGPDARLYVGQAAPAVTAEQHAAALAQWPATFAFEPRLGGDASSAGDMAWTYGRASWIRDGQERRGFYVRLWQKRATGWALAYLQLIPTPPRAVGQTPAPAPAPNA